MQNIATPSLTLFTGTYLASLLKHQPRHLAMAPPLVQFLAKSSDATPKHFESLEKVFLALKITMIHNQSKKINWLCDKVFVGAAPVGESLILEFLKKAPAAEFREVANIDSEMVKVRWFLRHGV